MFFCSSPVSKKYDIASSQSQCKSKADVKMVESGQLRSSINVLKVLMKKSINWAV